MTKFARFIQGPAPRHMELAQQAIIRAETGVEPLDWSITRAIDAALREVAEVGELTSDRRCRGLPRALSILRLRGSLTPIELGRIVGCKWASRMGEKWLRRLVGKGLARRLRKGVYVPAFVAPVGRPRKTDRKTPRPRAA